MSEPNKNAASQRWATVYEAMTGATAPGHDPHDEPTGTDGQSIQAGHEPDRFDVKGIVAVPILIAIVCAITYGIITVVFGVIEPMKPTTDNTTNPQAAEDAGKNYNERVAKISSSDEKAPVKQPRLEWMRTIPTKEGESIFHRSFRPNTAGNAPEITPQYLRPENFVDWDTGERKLIDYKWLNKEKGIARIPIAEAMEILTTSKKLPAKADGVAPVGTIGKPKLSNGGQANPPPVLPKAEAKKDEPKKDDHKH
jgi:hypothetical protein